MSEWETVIWQDVLTIKNGKNQKKVVNPEGRYPIYGSGGVMGYADDYLCEAKTTVIGRKGSINNPLYVNEKFWNVDTAFGLCAGEKLDNKFLYYFCITYNFLRHNKATTLPSLTKADLLRIKIPLPPLAEQQKIAEILDAADALRQKDQQLIDHYTTLSQSLFLEMFGDPVTNPMGWEKVKLENLGKITSGSTPRRDVDEYYQGIIPWVKTAEVNGKVITKTLECISELALQNSSCKLNPTGSLIIAMYGQGKTRGQVGRLGVRAATNQACAVIPPSDLMNYDYLFSLLKLLYDDLRSLGRGGNQPNLNGGLIKAYSVIAPPITLQNQFANHIASIEQQKQQAQASLAQSNNLFNSLLQKAFTGELTA